MLMEEENSNILVAIRIRPMQQKEVQSKDDHIIRCEDNLLVVLDPIDLEQAPQNRFEVLHRNREQRYIFDEIIIDQTTEFVYSKTSVKLINPVCTGFNACVFAYGTTGSGKTFTMLGNESKPGLNVLTIQDIFAYIGNQSQLVFDINIGYVEIYNETIKDLLTPSANYLDLRDDPKQGQVIAGMTWIKAESVEQVMSLLYQGNRRRTTESTNANITSSRSHAIFQIVVEIKDKAKNTKMDVLSGKLSLIDLAGSERGSVTENRGIRLREGAKINRSLLALANCINALGDKAKKGFYIPYRDSKLTRMLKDSLGGNCKTVMVACISPAVSLIIIYRVLSTKKQLIH